MSRTARPIGTLLLALSLLAGGAARAQDYEAAGRHFTAAQQAFAKHEYAKAAGEFQAAYDITKDPVLLYNVGEAQDKAGDLDAATAAYQRYLAEAPKAQDRADVEKRLATIAQRKTFAEAGRHFMAAQQAFAKGRYGKAVAEFHEAYEATKDPILLYNLGEAHEKAGNLDLANEYYKRYLTEMPKASDRKEVERRIAALDAKQKEQAKEKPWVPPPLPAPIARPAPAPAKPPVVAVAPAPAAPAPSTSAPAPSANAPAPSTTAPASGANETIAPSFEGAPAATEPKVEVPPPAVAAQGAGAVEVPPPPPASSVVVPVVPPSLAGEDHPSRLRVAAWIGVATTVGLLTAGAILGLAAQERADEITRQEMVLGPDGQPRAFDANLEKTISDLHSEGVAYNAAGITLMSLSAATAVTSAVLFLVDWRRHRHVESHLSVAPTWGKSDAGLSAHLEF